MSLRLAADTVRGHRRGILGWTVGSAVAITAIGAGFRSETERFAGCPKGMADSMQAGVQAMRLLRWPADRLDTLGGYLTYHNITLLVLFLTLYAAVQGEERSVAPRPGTRSSRSWPPDERGHSWCATAPWDSRWCWR
ncbi:hypothetical protein NS14008_28145 [Nocardia seriolae]|nr:hypothetical protein NS14008_28145 [Nocardia seriolae]